MTGARKRAKVGHMKKNSRDRRQKRREEALERAVSRSKRTNAEQLARLDEHGWKAVRERLRLITG